MNFFYNIFFPFLGGSGEAYDESRGSKYLVTLETYEQQGKTMDHKFFICININIFGYLGAGGGGGVSINNQTEPILVHLF